MRSTQLQDANDIASSGRAFALVISVGIVLLNGDGLAARAIVHDYREMSACPLAAAGSHSRRRRSLTLYPGRLELPSLAGCTSAEQGGVLTSWKRREERV